MAKLSFRWCPAGPWAVPTVGGGARGPGECWRDPVSTGDLPSPWDRGLPGEAGPASDPGGEFPHHPDRGNGSQQGDLEGATGEWTCRGGVGEGSF